MSDDVRVYDLGEVGRKARQRKPAWRSVSASGDTPPGGSASATQPDGHAQPVTAKPVTAGADEAAEMKEATAKTAPSAPAAERPRWAAPSVFTLSAALLVPGSGHLIRRRYLAGALWLGACTLFIAALVGSWNILPRLWRAAEALGLRPEASVWFLGVLLCGAALAHMISVLDIARREQSLASGRTHPLGAVAASTLVPGWGQLLNGHVARGAAGLFVFWTVIIAWTLALPAIADMLVAYRLHLPAPLAWLAGSTARWALPASIWPLAIYDAGLWAWMKRAGRSR